jgi:small subunit ribosomal protein S1
MSDKGKDGNSTEGKDFSDLLDSYRVEMRGDLRVGDKVEGEIISIGRDAVFVDTRTKTDGIVDKEELLNNKGEMSFKEGDHLELYVVSVSESEIRLSKAISGSGGLDLLRDALEAAIPVEGKVKELCKGGFRVEIMQRRAFCPGGQMDVCFVENPDDYVGKEYQFLITQIEEHGRNIVVSRRELLERELKKARQEFYETLTIGAQLEGRVTRLKPFGAFVELFPGIEGMVHLSELSWSRVEKPDDVVKVGESVTVKVVGIEEDEDSGQLRIGLSIKGVTGDPWNTVEDRFHEGDEATGTVTRCADFGAFVEVAPGIEGLVHISEMSYRKRVLKPQDVVKPGDTVHVIVKEFDAPRRRISLSIRDVEGDPWMEIEEKYHVGQSREGTVEKKEQFGYFITLEPGITGLLPKSRIKDSFQSASIEKLKEGDSIPVTIEEIKPGERKITLAVGDSRDEGDWERFARATEKPLDTLGEKLQQALKSKKKDR